MCDNNLFIKINRTKNIIYLNVLSFHSILNTLYGNKLVNIQR